MDIVNDERILQWFTLLDLSESTKRLYLIYMLQFCECNSKSPNELITEAIAETKAGLLLSERKTVSYIVRFKKYLKDKALSPNSQAAAMTCVKSFYKAFDIELSAAIKKTRRSLPLKENMTFLANQDVKKLITNAKSLRDKAIILCMVTSGMARSEILNLRMKDVNFEQNGVGVINIRRQKTQTDYSTFISPEAVIALQNYFEERKRSAALKVKGTSDFIFVTYPAADSKGGGRIAHPTFTLIFKQLAVQLGYKNSSFQIITKSHALRKFFASTLENAGMPKNKIDFMLGHTQNGTDMAYFRTDIEGLKQLYIKFLPYLTFEKTIEVRSLDTEDAKRLEELEKENEKLKIVIPEIQKAYEELIILNEEKDQAFKELVKRGEKMDSSFQKLLSCFPDNIKKTLINGKPMNEENFRIIPFGKKELEEAIERGKQQKK